MLLLIIYLLYAFVLGFLCSWVAKQKNRNSSNWFFLGVILGVLALIALAAVPALEKIENSVEDSLEPENQPLNYNPIPMVNEEELKLSFFGKIKRWW
jgi:hypothetical protein